MIINSSLASTSGDSGADGCIKQVPLIIIMTHTIEARESSVTTSVVRSVVIQEWLCRVCRVCRVCM